MSFDLKHVESFVSVAETLSFSVAAERSNTVQSAISSHIRLLEQQLKRTLVQRGRGQPVSLTADGVAFLVQARRLLALADEMARHPGSAVSMAPLRLGTTATFALSIVPKALSAYATKANARQVSVRTARSYELIDLIEQDQIDIALVFDQGAHPFRQSTIQVALAWVATHGYVQDPTLPLPLAFLEDARDLRRHAFAALDKKATHAASLHTHPDPIGMRAVLAAGLAVTIMPQISIVEPFADVGPRLGLPKPGRLPVSIYVAKRHREGDLTRLEHALAAELHPLSQ